MSSLARARIGEPASAFRRQAFPIGSVMLFSALPMLVPVIASSAILPPLGLAMFLAWRLLHPTLWPVWIGLPLGLWDDLFSGQPIGSAVGLWTLATLAIDYIDQRTYWRGYWQDWLIAAIAILVVQLIAAAIVHPGLNLAGLFIQTAFSSAVGILLFPVLVRLAARLDSVRLLRR
jgi:rod shape-determining protein MreD